MIILLHGITILECIDYSSSRGENLIKQRPQATHKIVFGSFYNLINKNKVYGLKLLAS